MSSNVTKMTTYHPLNWHVCLKILPFAVMQYFSRIRQQQLSYVCIVQCESKNIYLTFDHNVGKCRQIYKNFY